LRLSDGLVSANTCRRWQTVVLIGVSMMPVVDDGDCGDDDDDDDDDDDGDGTDAGAVLLMMLMMLMLMR